MYACTTLSQTLLEPAVVESTPARTRLIETRLTELHALGFEYERFGDTSLRWILEQAVAGEVFAAGPGTEESGTC